MLSLARKDLIAALGLAAVGMLISIPRLKGPLDLRSDGGAYYLIGTSLAEGKGYRLPNEPGNIQSTLHPPGLPIIAALFQRALHTDDFILVGHALRLLYLIFFITYSIAIFLLLRIFLALPYASLGSLLCILHPPTIFRFDLYFPELPFALMTVLFVLCNFKNDFPNRLSAPLAGISFAFRTAGIALLVAWAAESLFQWRFKAAATRLLVGLVFVVSWATFIWHVESGKEYHNPAYVYQRADYMYLNVSYARNTAYKDPFRPELGYATWLDKADRFFENLTLMPMYLGQGVSTTKSMWTLVSGKINNRTHFVLFPLWMIRVVIYLLAGLIAAGLWLLVVGRHYLIPVYVLFSLAMICSTPWGPEQFTRYLVPLAPFLSLSLFLGLQVAAGWVALLLRVKSGRVQVGLVCMIIPLLMLSQGLSLLTMYRSWHPWATYARDGNKVQYRLFFQFYLNRDVEGGLNWLKTNGRDRAVVAASDPQWTYLRTNLKSVLPPLEPNAARAQQLLDSVPVTFLIVDESLYHRYTTGVITAHPAYWRRVYSDSIVEGSDHTGSFEIYQRTGAD